MAIVQKVIKVVFEIFGHGGGKIKRKSIPLVIMLFALTLTFSANTVFATANTTTNASDQNSGQNLDKNAVKSSIQAAGSPTATKYPAAGSIVSTKKVTVTSAKNVTTQNSFTSSQINDAASRVKTFKDKNKRLPNYVTISSNQMSMAQFLKLMTVNVININVELNKSMPFSSVKNPTSNPKETVKKGSLTKTKYVNLAKNINSYIDKYGKAPNSASTSLGSLSFKNLVYHFSTVLEFYKINGRLPDNLSVSAWSSSSSPISEGTPSKVSDSTSNSALSQYLKVTTHAQSNSSTIKNLATSITKGKTTTYAKAQALFNWVRDHLSYSYYYNTKKGALGALSSRSANCVDTSHLVIALARAAGIPARYQHGTCKFSSGWYGHVWAQLYVNGKWYYADAISNFNTFGTIKNWNLKTVNLQGTYASLPF